MICPERQILDDYLVGDLPATQRQGYEEHFRTCETCQKFLARERQISERLRANLVLRAPAQLQPRVLAALDTRRGYKPIPDWLWMSGLTAALISLGILVAIYSPNLINPELSRGAISSVINKLLENNQIQSTYSWLQQWTGGSLVIVMNLFVGGVVLCWGLWQMVVALRK